MTKKEKNKLTQLVKLLEENAPKTKELSFQNGDCSFVVKVTPAVKLENRAKAVKTIANFILSQNASDLGHYTPEYTILAQKYAILATFTDITLPEDVNDLWLILNYTPIYDEVVELLNGAEKEIFAEAKAIVDSKLRYLENKTDLNNFINKAAKYLESSEINFTKEDVKKLLGVVDKVSSCSQEDIIKTIAETLKNDTQN